MNENQNGSVENTNQVVEQSQATTQAMSQNNDQLVASVQETTIQEPVPAQESTPETTIQEPVPAQESTPEATVQVDAPNQEVVQPVVQNDSPFFTPTSVQPETQVSPELPEIKSQEEIQQTNNNVQESQQPSVSTDAQPQENTEVKANEVEVIETVNKNKVGSFILILFLILLIVFVFKIDTIIEIYDNYMNSKTIVTPANNTNNNTNNLIDGFILIGENTSSIKINDIKFYNFKKSQEQGIVLSYESLANYEDAKVLEIYLELYNSEKEIIYKELFSPDQKLEKDTVRAYTINIEDNKIYSDAFYALVKVYSEEEKSKTSNLTCTFNDEKYSYKYIFNFINNGLTSYDVYKSLITKASNEATPSNDKSLQENEMIEENEETAEEESKAIVDEALQKEFDDVKESTNASFENNILKYNVDLNNDNSSIVTLFDKNTTLRVIKDKQTSKEWKCE